MNVLIVGSGGREHALAWKISLRAAMWTRSTARRETPGIEEYAECVPIGVLDFDGLAAFAKEKEIGLTVIGMDDPLVGGVRGRLSRRRGCACSAPARRRPSWRAPRPSPRI